MIATEPDLFGWPGALIIASAVFAALMGGALTVVAYAITLSFFS